MSEDLDITPADAAAAADAGEATLVDVRSREEWDAGRIDGAIHIPLDELSQRIDEIPSGRAVVFVCRVGGRSTMAAQALPGAKSMAGGMVRWAEEGRPLDPPDGTVADH